MVNIPDEAVCPRTDCKMCGQCARHARYQKAVCDEACFLSLNPTMLHPGDEGCSERLVERSMPFARGFKRMCATLTKQIADEFRFLAPFPSVSTYYRYFNGVKEMDLSIQQSVASCVRHYGGNPDVGFDHVEWRTVLVKP